MSGQRPSDPVSARAERVRRRELERALAELDDPSDAERAVLAALSRRITDEVAAPFAADPAARRLFLPD